MIRKADIRKEHHVLEIGSGWGALAMEAVRSTGRSSFYAFVTLPQDAE